MENEVARAIVLEDVLKERERQDSMYGDQKSHTRVQYLIRRFPSNPLFFLWAVVTKRPCVSP